MLHVGPRRTALVTITLLAAFVLANRASAAGAVNISTCRTLSDFGTVYRLTANLTSCGDCLIVANNQITIDLQGHSITSTTPQCGLGASAITDQFVSRDLIVVRNGTVSGYDLGVSLRESTRASVLGVKANVLGTTAAGSVGIAVGPHGLVKGSEATSNPAGNDAIGILIVGPRGQVQQSNAHDNRDGIRAVGADNCLITANTASSNVAAIVVANSNRCTISFNTANDNERFGIVAGAGFGTGHLVTGNVALNNREGMFDYQIGCPSTVTNNDSTKGFPASYDLLGNGCKTSNNQ
jgi:parallel beta-helix repeat protein